MEPRIVLPSCIPPILIAACRSFGSSAWSFWSSLCRRARSSLSEREVTLVITAQGRASSSANTILRCGASGVDELAAELETSLRSGIYLLSDVHLLYLCISDNFVDDYSSREFFPPDWAMRFVRIAWPGGAKHRTGLASTLALIEPKIDAIFCESLDYVRKPDYKRKLVGLRANSLL